ncbi:hypothetical protein OESDEN_02942 [Oesophagostomum dentatum]|uniref:Uncharacterized protein n=1 Tax=Oesophagostomum dentatum TaxID=61180 RepID=A0A0B1TNW9_OESDE|nr:hypothetical protein OESDEN_02942 [Oesophagostomum dentatum]
MCFAPSIRTFFRYNTGNAARDLEYRFKLGETFTDTGFDGKQHKITITMDGDLLKEVHFNLERDVGGEDVFYYSVQNGSLFSVSCSSCTVLLPRLISARARAATSVVAAFSFSQRFCFLVAESLLFAPWLQRRIFCSEVGALSIRPPATRQKHASVLCFSFCSSRNARTLDPTESLCE